MSDAHLTQKVADLEAENGRLRRLLDRQGMPSTLRHQVRNALGLMRVILRRSSDSKATVEDFAAHLEGRFDALLRVQTTLLSSPDGGANFYTLVLNELTAHVHPDDDKVSIDGPDVRIEARHAELLGLVIHELATNAVKFGALTASRGRLEVSWRLVPEPHRLVLTWRESGLTRGDDIPTFRGFGTDAIEGMLPYQIKADSTIAFRPDGLLCTIAVPLPAEQP